MLALHRMGFTKSFISRAFGLSKTQVGSILRRECKWQANSH
jgi:hypothetical protein